MEWFEQPDNESCGPTAIINIQRYFGVDQASYTFRRLKRLCKCDNKGTSKIWMGRVLCEVAAYHGWTLKTCRQVEHLRLLVAQKTTTAVMFIQTKLYPQGHYFVVVDYDDGIFTCIGGVCVEQSFRAIEWDFCDSSEAHIWVVVGKVVN